MIISSSITTGQITFVVRVAIQVLGYVSLGLISVIVLASVSRVATINTHGLINRLVGSYTTTPSSLRWIFDQIHYRHSNTSPKSFILLLFLSVSYTIFVSLSDIGLIGFHACPVPSPDITDFPASITSRSAAIELVAENTANGTDVSKVFAHRCDSSNAIRINRNVTRGVCLNWYNSTYNDGSFFKTNLTDSDTLMSRQLTNYRHPRAPQLIGVNSFYAGPNTQRLLDPTIQRGLAIEPHDRGVRMVVGVPQLQPGTRVVISNTLAVEVDVGCMTLGVNDVDFVTYGNNIRFATNGTWRRYVGPDYMESVLSETVDDVRAYFRPFFNSSTLDSNGTMSSFNSSFQQSHAIANVDTYRLPNEDFRLHPDEQLIGNCTQALREKLGIAEDPIIPPGYTGNMCSFLGVGGATNEVGPKRLAFERMVCSAATQVNMVDATVSVNADNQVSFNLTRIPSDLNIVTATDFWKNLAENDVDDQFNYIPYQRYTLNPNSNSPSSHFVYPGRKPVFDFRSKGPGSAGSAISWISHHILSLNSIGEPEYMALRLLPDDGSRRSPRFDPSEVTKLAGEVGGSFLLTSLGFNGWTALQSPPMRVVNTGGRIGTCYKPYYAIAFIPLVVSAAGLFVWMAMSMLNGSWFGTKVVEMGYGGVAPYTAVTFPEAPPKDTLLAWEASPEPQLQVVEKDYLLEGDANATALEYLKSAHATQSFSH